MKIWLTHDGGCRIGDAATAALDVLRKPDEDLRVLSGASGCGENDFITGFFREAAQLALEKPRERMKPEDTWCEGG